MRSEIPQLEVVTAIADADFEDFVAQLLFSQGWSIIYRAFDTATMIQFLETRSSLRTVIIYHSDLSGFASNLLLDYDDQPFTFISLDGSEAAAHAVMQKIRSQLRLPLVQILPIAPIAPITPNPQSTPPITTFQREIVASPKVLTVTGSAGAPGRTSFVLALGQEIVNIGGRKVVMVDLDFRSPSLTRRLGRSRLNNPGKKAAPLLPLLSVDATSKPTMLPPLNSNEIAIVDLGVLPALGEVVHDRRWQGCLVSSILDATTQLLYVVRSTEESLDELAHFLTEFPILLRKIPITYICILVGNSRELRESEARFLTLTSAESRFLLRESQLMGRLGPLGSLGLLASPKPGKGEIGKIVASLI